MTTINQKFEEYKASLEASLSEPVSISGLCGPLRIFQRLNGHRHSIDDAATAWYALKKSPTALNALDLGTGIGSVGLAVLWGLSAASASLTCVEAQEVSFKLLQANIKCNGLDDRVEAIYGDLRNLDLGRKFDLITGSPPYFPSDAGIIPTDSQKAHARFELRGNVGDYARIAKMHLSEDGVFIFCFPYQQKTRCMNLVEETGFKIATVQDVVPRISKPPLFSLYSARLDFEGPVLEEPPLIVANEKGEYSEEMLELQRSRGFGQLGTNKI